MSQAFNQTSSVPVALLPQDEAPSTISPFAGLIDALIVDDPVLYPFAGSLARSHAGAAWTWVVRDLCADLINAEALERRTFVGTDLEVAMPEILGRMRAALEHADADPDAARRLRVTLGSEEIRREMPAMLSALRNRAVLGKAQEFGRAINAITEEAALGQAIQSMPLQDAALAALLFHAVVGQVNNPSRMIAVIVKLTNNSNEKNVANAGFAPVVDALLAHAQNQLHLLQPIGPFADIDLTCRALDRFHRLIRALTGYIEFSRGSRWSMILSALTKQVSERVEPRLRDVVSDVNLSLRQTREGQNRLDNDRLLAAINGVYLLSTIRDCRDSLALNALFEQAWVQSGQALELHLQHNLDLLRHDQADINVLARLEAGIKMAEVRFNPEYAETLRRARATALRRI